jgi:hypothetical protein
LGGGINMMMLLGRRIENANKNFKKCFRNSKIEKKVPKTKNR